LSTPVESPIQNRSHCNQWRSHGWLWLLVLGTFLHLYGAPAYAQTCQSSGDISTDVQTALKTTAQRYFEMTAHGDVAGLRQNSIPSLAADFAGIEGVVKDNQAAFAGAKATVRPPFLLIADGAEPLARAEFLCGVFGKTGQTENSAVFILPNLPPGKYGVTIFDVNSGEKASTLTFILPAPNGNWVVYTPGPRKLLDTMPPGLSNVLVISRPNRRITMRGCTTAKQLLFRFPWTS
jgi:hypothetical protein